MANKVKYGLKNVHYAKATIGADGTATYGTVKPLSGAVNLTLDAEGETNTFYADNIAYAQFSANAGYSGSLELALIPDSFRIDILGEIEDNADVMLEDAGATTSHFALMFQFEGDDTATKHVMYNCVASRPSISGQTTEASIEAQTETLDLTCGSVFNEDLEKDIVKAKCPSTSTAYATWFSAVYQATALS